MLFFLPFAACLDEGQNVTLTFEAPPLVEPSAVVLTILPFDLDAMIDSLTRASLSARPEFPDADSSLLAFDGDSPTGLDTLDTDWSVLRNRVSRLADSLSQVERTDAGYDDAYDRLRSLYADLTAREFALENRLKELMSSVAVQRAARATDNSDSLRRWENEALRGLPAAMESATVRSGRQPLVIRGVESDLLRPRLHSGSWWAVVRVQHPENPFLEYYWNVPFTVNRLVPAVVPIGSHNKVTRWRH